MTSEGSTSTATRLPANTVLVRRPSTTGAIRDDFGTASTNWPILATVEDPGPGWHWDFAAGVLTVIHDSDPVVVFATPQGRNTKTMFLLR